MTNIYIQFTEDGHRIRKWSREPFEGGVGYGEQLAINPCKIEATARAMCQALGKDGDLIVDLNGSSDWHQVGPQWLNFRENAIMAIAAKSVLDTNAKP